MAKFNPALVQKILDFAERKREPTIRHNGQADNFWSGSEIPKWAAFWYSKTLSTLQNHLTRGGLVSSINAKFAPCTGNMR